MPDDRTKLTNVRAPSRRVPRQARAQARVALILKATREIVLEEGANAVNTRSIAVRAGIPVGSVYQYFKDREELLRSLYISAYEEVVGASFDEVTALGKGFNWGAHNRQLLHSFWSRAHRHPSFLPLTRWYNNNHALWEVVPDETSGLAVIISMLMDRSSGKIPAARREMVLKTAVSSFSVLIDQAIEEEDEIKALGLIDEIGSLIEAYLIKPYQG